MPDVAQTCNQAMQRTATGNHWAPSGSPEPSMGRFRTMRVDGRPRCYLFGLESLDHVEPQPTRHEARRYHAASRAQIDHTLARKEQLMGELASWIEEHHLRQAEAAEILCVTRPRVSDVVNRKTSKFTIDALVDMLARIGKPVSLVVG